MRNFRTPLLALALLGSVAISPAMAAPPSPDQLVGPVAAYKVYVTKEVDTLVAQTKVFAAAVKAGDLAKAKKLYAPTRVHYERIEPIAELFSDIDNNVDSRADDHQKKEQDP
ncbi:MAG TPA: imelysin family protein, partial [Stellaceae bacterium]|nr:imelysin family protein [Stellaceae bacterium]